MEFSVKQSLSVNNKHDENIDIVINMREFI